MHKQLTVMMGRISTLLEVQALCTLLEQWRTEEFVWGPGNGMNKAHLNKNRNVKVDEFLYLQAMTIMKGAQKRCKKIQPAGENRAGLSRDLNAVLRALHFLHSLLTIFLKRGDK